MFLGLLRIVAYALAFWFVYRVVVGALRYLSSKPETKETPRGEPSSKSDKSDPSLYRDVKDARFKDIPDDSAKPS